VTARVVWARTRRCWRLHTWQHILFNIGTPLKHDKYTFDIPIPFCHHLYLSATLKQSFSEFAVVEKVTETDYACSTEAMPIYILYKYKEYTKQL
jgi:hypothetical protein